MLIEGPKWCGKTTTAEEIAASKILLARTDVKNNFKSLLEQASKSLPKMKARWRQNDICLQRNTLSFNKFEGWKQHSAFYFGSYSFTGALANVATRKS